MNEMKETEKKQLGYGYFLSGNKIDKNRPYDNADYYWAKMSNGGKWWMIIKAGKIKTRIEILHDDVVVVVAKTLFAFNKGIEPIMVHN